MAASHKVRRRPVVWILYALVTVLEVNCTIRRYHVYKRHWNAVVGEVLTLPLFFYESDAKK